MNKVDWHTGQPAGDSRDSSRRSNVGSMLLVVTHELLGRQDDRDRIFLMGASRHRRGTAPLFQLGLGRVPSADPTEPTSIVALGGL